MVEFYLVTGFLGAGKTTFLKNFVRLLAPRRLRLIVNEYGKVGVDGELLREIGAVMDEINNGSIFCSCRLDKFEEVLDDVLLDPPEAVVVEASGLSDPTAIRRILGAEKYAAFDYKGAVCIVDAQNFHKVYETARVCPKQLSVSDVVLVNKTDAAPPERVRAAVAAIRERYPDAVVHETSYGRVDPAWMRDLGRVRGGDGAVHDRDLTLQKYTVAVKEAMTRQQMESFLKMFIEDTYRLKGFVRLADGVFLVDCVGALVNVVPWDGDLPPETGTVVVLAGKGMNPRKSMKNAAEWYPGLIERVE